MATIDEVTEAEIWLQTTLSASSAVVAIFGTSISTNPADRDAAYPLLTYECLSPSTDLMLVGTNILWANLRFLVRGIVEGDDTLAIRSGVIAVFDAIHGQYGYTDNAYIVSCVRLRPFKMTEMQDSKQYTHLGAEYSIRIRRRS